jgi:hypothetical protein
MHKHVARPHVANGPTDFMHNPSVVRAAVEWIGFNEANRLLEAKHIPIRRVRYEDLVRNPQATSERILEFAGCAPATVDAGEFAGPAVDLPKSHGLAGNPMRFRAGRVSVAEDDEWRADMPSADRVVATVLTAPWLAKYGYGIRR